MRSPAAAIFWELRQGHRWGLAALAAYWVVLAGLKLLGVAGGQPVRLDSPERFAIAVPVPLAATLMYLLAIFSFGFAGDFAGRRSIYPARMFTLPVTTAALVGWPMLYGGTAMAILWLLLKLLVPWPSGVSIPVVWPGLLAAVLLAWTQALAWMPYGFPGLRVVVMMVWLAAIDTLVLLALHFQASEAVMLALLAPLLPLAILVARLAVARARRGEVPDWRAWLARPAPAPALSGRGARRDRPSRAQAWFEWRRHGRSLPALVGILLPFELALLFTARGAPELTLLIVLGALFTPPFLANVTAVAERDAPAGTYRLSPFVATRPLSDAALVAAKLKVAVWSTLAAWLLVAIGLPLALVLSDNTAPVIERADRLIETLGIPRAATVAALALAALLASTYKGLVQRLFVGLSGREWLVRSSLFLTLSVLVVLGPLALWIGDHVGLVWNALPRVLALLAGLKLAAAAGVAARLWHRGLVSDRTLVAGVAGWVAVVLALHGVLVWLVNLPLVPSYLLLLVAILATPVARIAAATLAVAGSRHR